MNQVLDGKECNVIFVYGTLKKGHRANYMMDGAEYLGKAVTNNKYDMYDCGFPKLISNADGHPVEVEAYLHPNWDMMDSYEGVPHLYRRRVITGTMEDGSKVRAWIYEAVAVSGEPVDVMPNGNYWWGG